MSIRWLGSLEAPTSSELAAAKATIDSEIGLMQAQQPHWDADQVDQLTYDLSRMYQARSGLPWEVMMMADCIAHNPQNPTGYVAQYDINHANYLAAKGSGRVPAAPSSPIVFTNLNASSSSSGSDSGGLILGALVIAGILAVAFGGSGKRRANPMALAQSLSTREQRPHVLRVDVTPARDDGGRLRRPGYTIWDGNYPASPAWAPTLDEAIADAISYGEWSAGGEQAVVVFVQDEATGKYQNVYQAPRRIVGPPAAVALPFDWNENPRVR